MLLKGQSVTLCGFVVVCAVWLCLLCLTGPNIVSLFGVHCQFLQGIFVVCVAIFFHKFVVYNVSSARQLGIDIILRNTSMQKLSYVGNRVTYDAAQRLYCV